MTRNLLGGRLAGMAFGAMLRSWRSARRCTQEELADAAEISTRHLSCLESGKANPSREMVLVLASALDLPLRDRNLLLNAAGYVAAYSSLGLDAEPMRPVRAALATMLAHQASHPTFVFDTGWNVMMVNKSAETMMSLFLPQRLEPKVSSNLVHALFHPAALRTCMVNWTAVASHALARLRRDVAGRPHDQPARAALDVALSYASDDLSAPEDTLMPFLPIHLRRGDHEARFFTLLSSLGAPLDVTAQELLIETYYPADAATARWLATLAGPADSAAAR